MAYSGDRTEGRSQNSTVRCRDSERYLSQEPLTSSEDREIFILSKLQGSGSIC